MEEILNYLNDKCKSIGTTLCDFTSTYSYLSCAMSIIAFFVLLYITLRV